MTFTSARLAAALVPLALILTGCEEFNGTTAADGSDAAAAAQLGPSEPRTELRDVERADVFSVTDTGLWDGRPSLGGIWVAHPDVTDPERAKITNASTGQTVAGALFRRERANPGPRIQVSSDAAAALGMLAGQPVELSIVAVRQEEIVIEPAPLPLSDEAPEIDDADADLTESQDAEIEAAAADSDVDDPALQAAIASGAVEIVSDEPAKKGFWGRFRDSLRNKPAADVAAEADTALIEGTAESAAVPDVDTAPLDPVTAVAAAAIAEAEETESPRARPATTQLQNPYVQVGLFSVEENASAAASSLRQAGIVPSVEPQSSNDRTLWRVFVGPVTTTEDQAELLAQIRKLGYKDAFLAPN